MSETDRQIAEALREVVRRGAADDAARVRGLLADLIPGMPAPARVAVAAVQEGVPADLRRATASGSAALAIARGIDRLVDQHGYKRALATRVVHAWAAAVGHAPSAAATETSSPDASGGRRLEQPRASPSQRELTTCPSLGPASEYAGFHPLAMGRDLFHKTGPNGGMVPGLTPTSAKVRAKNPEAAHHVYTAPGSADAPAMSHQEWIDNARKAKAAGIIHEYAGANNNDEYHKTFGTSKGGQLSVSVINPRTGKSTVAMGVKVPDPNNPNGPHKVAHFMWDEAHPAGARYVPMLGVHDNGAAFVGNRFVDEKHGHFHEARALQHMAEWLSMMLPGHNIVKEAGSYATLPKHFQTAFHDHINNDTNIVDGAEDAMKKLTDSSVAPGVRKQAWEDIHKHLHAKINGVSQYIDNNIQNGTGMPVVPVPMDPAPTPTDPDNKILRAMGPTYFYDSNNFGSDKM